MWYARPHWTGQAKKHLHMELSLVFFSTLCNAAQLGPNAVLYCKRKQQAQSIHLPSASEQCVGQCSSDALSNASSQHQQSSGGCCPALLPATNTQRFLTALAVMRGLSPGNSFEMSPWMWRYGRGQPKRSLCLKLRSEGRSGLWHAGITQHQGAVTLKRRLEQRGTDFYERQRSRRAGQAAADQE